MSVIDDVVVEVDVAFRVDNVLDSVIDVVKWLNGVVKFDAVFDSLAKDVVIKLNVELVSVVEDVVVVVKLDVELRIVFDSVIMFVVDDVIVDVLLDSVVDDLVVKLDVVLDSLVGDIAVRVGVVLDSLVDNLVVILDAVVDSLVEDVVVEFDSDSVVDDSLDEKIDKLNTFFYY